MAHPYTAGSSPAPMEVKLSDTKWEFARHADGSIDVLREGEPDAYIGATETVNNAVAILMEEVVRLQRRIASLTLKEVLRKE